MPDDPSDNLEQTVLNAVREVLEPGDDFTASSSLLDTGLDSFSITQLLLEIEEETDIWLDESYLTRDHLQDVKSLTTCLREVAGSDLKQEETSTTPGSSE